MENIDGLLGANLIELLKVIHKYLHSLEGKENPFMDKTSLVDTVDIKLIKKDDENKK